jgi:hypothetical protein
VVAKGTRRRSLWFLISALLRSARRTHECSRLADFWSVHKLVPLTVVPDGEGVRIALAWSAGTLRPPVARAHGNIQVVTEGSTTAAAREIRELKRKSAELKQTVEILKAATSTRIHGTTGIAGRTRWRPGPDTHGDRDRQESVRRRPRRAGFTVCPINPKALTRYRVRHRVRAGSGPAAGGSGPAGRRSHGPDRARRAGPTRRHQRHRSCGPAGSSPEEG